MPVYSIHIIFDDGSNPYIRYHMSMVEFAEELKKWDKNYILIPLTVDLFSNIFNFAARQRGDASCNQREKHS